MPNKAFLDANGFLNNVFEGDQDGETMNAINADNETLIENLPVADRRPVRILMDATGIGSVDTGARKRGAELMKQGKHEFRLAVVGANPLVRNIMNLLMRVSRAPGETRYFKSPDAARKWLRR